MSTPSTLARFPYPAGLASFAQWIALARHAQPAPRRRTFQPKVTRRQDHLLAVGACVARQAAHLSWEKGTGSIPTVVVGGFVPEPAEAVYLQRRLLLSQGDVYYMTFGPSGFSTDLFSAQLEDLLEDLEGRGTPPVILSVSFGAGLVMECLKRAADRRGLPIAGLLMISPVGCLEDILEPGTAKPSTLLGRVVKGFLDLPPDAGEASRQWIDRSRTVLLKMFESGAQNKEALARLLRNQEVARIRAAIAESMRRTEFSGGWERTQAMATFRAPGAEGVPERPLTDAPTLVLYAEKETSIMVETAPTRRALESNLEAFFPHGSFAIISNPRGSPVQHASLLFHARCFNRPIRQFYARATEHLGQARRIQQQLFRLLGPARAWRPGAQAAAAFVAASLTLAKRGGA